MSNQLEFVYPKPAPQVQAEAVKFWRENEAVSDEQSAVRRARELLVVARDSAGQMIGVSTCQTMMIDRLGFKCFYYRSVIGKQHRVRGLRGPGLAQKDFEGRSCSFE